MYTRERERERDAKLRRREKGRRNLEAGSKGILFVFRFYLFCFVRAAAETIPAAEYCEMPRVETMSWRVGEGK